MVAQAVSPAFPALGVFCHERLVDLAQRIGLEHRARDCAWRRDAQAG
jgi:hypothetical protein